MTFNQEFIKILYIDNKELKTKVKTLEKIIKSKINFLRKENEILKTRVQFLTNLIEYNEAILFNFAFN